MSSFTGRSMAIITRTESGTGRSMAIITHTGSGTGRSTAFIAHTGPGTVGDGVIFSVRTRRCDTRPRKIADRQGLVVQPLCVPFLDVM